MNIPVASYLKKCVENLVKSWDLLKPLYPSGEEIQK